MRHRDSNFRFGLPLSRIATAFFIALSAVWLTDCSGERDLAISAAANAVQPFPFNYRVDLIAFLRTYLNDPRGIREAVLAEPALREVRARKLFVACLRYNARTPDGAFPGASERAVVFVDGRLDRLVEDGKDYCAGAVYQPFPEMEKLAR